MDVLLRLLLRFILVPLGYLAAVIAGACVILLGSWRFAEMLVSQNPDVFAAGVLGFALAGPVLFVMLFSAMLLPGAVGILICGSVCDPLLDLPCAERRDLGLGRLADVRVVRWKQRAAQRDAICVRRRPCGRLRLLGGRGLERGLLEAGVPATDVAAAK